mmetsp:Transcript_35760/g.86833  ORF Transcript_35760/g.86833 Transcript_35760/m.86833 type:complete len:119 (+) Transcript_35760:3261-3617(+)
MLLTMSCNDNNSSYRAVLRDPSRDTRIETTPRRRRTGDDDGTLGGTTATKEPSADDSQIKTDPATASDNMDDGPNHVLFVSGGEMRARTRCTNSPADCVNSEKQRAAALPLFPSAAMF